MDSHPFNNKTSGVIRDLWRELLAGSLKIASVHANGFELWLTDACAPAPTPRRARRQAHFDAALRGQLQKTLAADSQVAPSTLSTLVRDAAAEMGVDAPLSRIPAALPLLAHAARSPRLVVLREVATERNSERLWRLSFLCPEKILETQLSHAEQDVVGRYIEGQSYLRIAAARGVSHRTIANQLARSFQKLRTSSRLALLRNVVERGAALGTPIQAIVNAAP